MERLILAGVVASLCAAGLAAQPAVSINNEPHHKRLLYTNDVRLWEVTIPAGQSTPPFVHDYDVATVVIADGSVNVAEHTGAPGTSRIANPGTTEYRAFQIENMHETKQNPPFTITDLVLKPDAPETMHEHMGATIVVLISGSLQQGGIGGTDPVRLQQPGQWLTIPRFQAHTMTAVGRGDARAIEIEVR